ncbi:hypothetical protein HDK64DRAFT_255977 [Phyllosticta capitalensis]
MWLATMEIQKALIADEARGFARRLWTAAPGTVTVNEVIILEAALMVIIDSNVPTDREVQSTARMHPVTYRRALAAQWVTEEIANPRISAAKLKHVETWTSQALHAFDIERNLLLMSSHREHSSARV